MSNINTFKLSQNWFENTYDNHNIKPIHTALYFYIVDMWNNMHWKDNFQIPTTYSMEKLNISSYKTYIKALTELEEFGSIKIIERAKNRHTANRIKVVKITNEDTNEDTKASPKRLPKQVQPNYQVSVSIIKQYNKEQINQLTINHKEVKSFLKTLKIEDSDWRNDFEIYKSDLRKVYNKLINDLEFIKEQQELNPNINIKLTLKKACVNYWSKEVGWKKKKASKSKTIDWKTTLTNSLSQSMNKVYCTKEEQAAINHKSPEKPKKW